MMVRFFASLLLVLGISGFCWAQINADSILQIALDIPGEEDRLAFLDGELAGIPLGAFDDPVPLVLEQLSLVKQQQDLQTEVKRALDLVWIYNFQGRYALADSFALSYVKLVDKVEQADLKVELLHEAAKSAFFGQAYGDGIRYDTMALAHLEKVDNQSYQDSMAAQLNNYLGKSYNASGQFVAAALALSDGIELLREHWPQDKLLQEMYTELGIVYSQIGLYDRAVEYLDYSAEIAPTETAKAQTQINIGRNLILTKDYPAAVKRYRKVFTYELPPNLENVIFSYAYNGMVEVNYRLKQIDSLEIYFKDFAAVMATEEGQQQVSPFLFRQSEFLYALSQGNLNQAQQIGEELYEEAIAKNDPAEQLMYTEFLTDVYRKRGDFRKAERFTRELMLMKDSIQSANRNNALLLYYNQFELKEKENDILRVTAERQQVAASQRLFQTAAGLLGLLLLTGGFFYYRLRKARRQLADQNIELNELNATKDRFFGIIAHDLRNPIVALSTAGTQVDRLLARGKTDMVKTVVGSVSDTADRLNSLLDNLLQWALGQSGAITLRREALQLDQLVDENFAIYSSAAADKQIKLKHDIPETTRVWGDHNALQTILRNLVGNAVKFSPKDEGATISVEYAQEGNMNLIRVKDQGVGISATEMDKLFKLHRGEGSGGHRKSGTGLGLILCKDLVELHGGKIEVASKPGEGSVFTVRLPQA